MRGAAVISTGWERTGVVLKTVEIGRPGIMSKAERVPMAQGIGINSVSKIGP